jgi:hypothetical protein
MIIKSPRWNDADREKTKKLREKRGQRHFVYHKSHIDWPELESIPPKLEAGLTILAMARLKHYVLH